MDVYKVCKSGVQFVVRTNDRHEMDAGEYFDTRHEAEMMCAEMNRDEACDRCNGEGRILVADRPYPNDISPPAHSEPCPECR